MKIQGDVSSVLQHSPEFLLNVTQTDSGLISEIYSCCLLSCFWYSAFCHVLHYTNTPGKRNE